MADEWCEMRWGDLATLEYGRALRGYEGGVGRFRVFGTNGPIGWHEAALCDHASVIIGRKGAYRGVHYSPAPFFAIDTAFYLEPKTQFDMRWAYYQLLTQDINRMDSGSAIPSTSRDAFYALPVRVPPPYEQRAIAHILGTLDDKIELNRRMSETLEAVARALFKSWFVDFDPVRAKVEGREPGIPQPIADDFPDRFVDSELGEIPEGWRVDTLESVLTEIEVGGRPRGGVTGYTDGIPSIGAESIVGLGVFDYSKTKYVPRAFFDRMTKGHVRSRDVLLYKDGGRPGEFEPHVSMFGDGFPFDRCAINEHVYRLRANAHFGQNLLYLWLSSDAIMEEMRIKGTGVAVPGLNSTQVRSLTTLVPDSKLTRAFNALVEPIIARVLSSCNESRTLRALRDALLPKLISGELRVQNAEQPLKQHGA